MQNFNSFQQIVLIIIIINVAFSLMGFGNIRHFEKMKFRIGDILGNKEYYRIISSAFLHGSYFHLFLNMFVLYSFSFALERYISIPVYLAIYFGSLILGNLLPLFIHKNNPNYSAVGASGAVSGVLYASIYFNPFGMLYIYFIPMTNWIFGILYLVYTVWAAKKSNDNIGHDAHFGGATAGLVMAFFIMPEIAFKNWLIILAMFVPIIYFLYDVFKNNKGLKPFIKSQANHSDRAIDDLYNYNRTKKIREFNELLDKVNSKGIESLSTFEKERLDRLSKELE